MKPATSNLASRKGNHKITPREKVGVAMG